MLDEKEIKTFCAVLTETESGQEKRDDLRVFFVEKEINEDPYYKVTVLKNMQIFKERSFTLKDFDAAVSYFVGCQNSYLGKVLKTFDFNEWNAL